MHARKKAKNDVREREKFSGVPTRPPGPSPHEGCGGDRYPPLRTPGTPPHEQRVSGRVEAGERREVGCRDLRVLVQEGRWFAGVFVAENSHVAETGFGEGAHCLDGELSREGAAHVKRSTLRDLPRVRIFVGRMTSDRKLRVSREGSK